MLSSPRRVDWYHFWGKNRNFFIFPPASLRAKRDELPGNQFSNGHSFVHLKDTMVLFWTFLLSSSRRVDWCYFWAKNRTWLFWTGSKTGFRVEIAKNQGHHRIPHPQKPPMENFQPKISIFQGKQREFRNRHLFWKWNRYRQSALPNRYQTLAICENSWNRPNFENLFLSPHLSYDDEWGLVRKLA